MIGRDDALKAAQSSPRIITRPMAPMVVGLRELNGFPPTLTRRVFMGPRASSLSAAAPLLLRLMSPTPRLGRGLEREVEDLAAGQLDRPADVAEVEVEPRPVAGGTHERAEHGRQLVDDVLDRS